MLPLVVVMAEPTNKLTSRPALNKTLPLVVVIASLTLTSRPQHTTRLPLVAVIAWLMFTSPAAFKVSVVALPAAVHEAAFPIASLTLISPWPGAAKNVVAVLVPVTSVLMVTLLLTSKALRSAPVISPPRA